MRTKFTGSAQRGASEAALVHNATVPSRICKGRVVPRYLLQQWTRATIAEEDREYRAHGGLWATPSSASRLLDLEEDDAS